MKVNIRGNGQVKLSPEARNFITSKVEELEKLFNRSEHLVANVLCRGFEKYTVTEITIPTKHIIFRAESKGDTLYLSVEKAVDKLEQQAIRQKKKVNSLMKKREGIAEYFSDKVMDTPSVDPVVVRTKEVDMQVMTVEEAITQLELIDHDFYVFINEENHKVTVVYLRDDGGYGTIEPK